MARLPPSSPAAKPAPSSGPISASIPPLPVKVYLKQLTVDRIAVARAVTQTAAIAVGLTGDAQVTGNNEGQAHLVLRDLDGSGVYTAQASLSGNDLAASVHLDEPTRGMLSRLASLPDLGALHLALTLDGPQNKAAVGLALSAGALTASAKGTVDIPGEAADLAIEAHAPAMKPAPGIGWQSVDVALHTSGPFTAPDATGHVVLTGLSAQGVALARLTADIQGSLGAVSLKASLAGLAAPGLPPGLLGDAPIAVTANAVLKRARPPGASHRKPSAADPACGRHDQARSGGEYRAGSAGSGAARRHRPSGHSGPRPYHRPCDPCGRRLRDHPRSSRPTST